MITLAVSGSILMKGDLQNKLKKTMKYCSGIDKPLHLMQWTRPEMYNALQELSCHMTMTSELHYKAMLTMIIYCDGTRN